MIGVTLAGPFLCGVGALLLLAAYAMNDAARPNHHDGRHIRHEPARVRGGRHRPRAAAR